MTLRPTDDTLPGERGHADAAEPVLRPNHLVDGRYRLVRQLGAGGMGEVWEVEHIRLRQPMALKLLLGAEVATKTQRGRFLREAQVVAGIRHPGVVEITDFGELPTGAPFIAMELLEGRTLRQVCVDEGALPWPRTLGLVRQIASALAEVHRHGVVHRDLKPDNIFVAPGPPESAKVIDFGIAGRKELDTDASKLTATGSVFGTPGYMAPEQIRGEPADVRADVYALGCVAYEVLAGRRVFDGGLFERLRLHLYEAPAPLPPSIPSSVRRLVAQCLAKRPDERFETMDAIVNACDIGLGSAGPRRTAVANTHVPVVPPGASPQFETPIGAASTAPVAVRVQPLAFQRTRPTALRAVAGLLAAAGVGVVVLLALAWSRGPRTTPASTPQSPPAVVLEPVVEGPSAVSAPAPTEPVVERAVEKPKPASDSPPVAKPRRRAAKPKPSQSAPAVPNPESPKLGPDGTFDVFGE